MAKRSSKAKESYVEEVVVVFEKPIERRQPEIPLKELKKKTQECHHIHKALKKLRRASFQDLHEKTRGKCKFSRVVSHINWAVGHGYATLATRRIRI